MKKRRTEAAADVHCQTVKQGMSDEQSKTPGVLTRLRENNPHPTTELNFSSLLNC